MHDAYVCLVDMIFVWGKISYLCIYVAFDFNMIQFFELDMDLGNLRSEKLAMTANPIACFGYPTRMVNF